MQFLLFLITSLFATTAYLGSTDLFASDSELLSNDASNPDAQSVFGGDNGLHLSTNDIWNGGESDLLDYDTGNRYLPSVNFITTEVDDPIALL